MHRKLVYVIAAGLLVAAVAHYAVPAWRSGPQTVQASTISGTGTLSGVVEAPKAFQAAQVYARNTNRNVLYMVYTARGRYRAVNLLPGRYEVTVKKNGFAADAKNVAIEAGSSMTADFALREAEPEVLLQGGNQGPEYALGRDKIAQGEIQLLAYDELYPPGPAREVAEGTCFVCHGLSFIPRFQWNETQWNAAVEMMVKMGNVKVSSAASAPPNSSLDGAIRPEDRQGVVAYLAKHFGPGSSPRALKIDVEMPLDEQALSRAMYVEYFLPTDEKGSWRKIQEPYFDKDGNVWYTDRSIPNKVGRLDPRTATVREYLLPDTKADPHGVTVDPAGHVWWGEIRGWHLGRLDPQSGEITRYPLDAAGQHKGWSGHTPVVDHRGDVWVTVIGGNRLGKWDPQTQQVKVWELPTPNSSPYGVAVDHDNNLWMAESYGCKIAKFDTQTEKFTEYPSPSRPCRMKRVGIDSKGIVWYAVFSGGKLGKLDPKTGKIVEYDIPLPFSAPYDTWPDAEDNIWISDAGQGGALIKFDPETEKFTYYPTPQRTDQPKLEITRDGAIVYTTRAAPIGAVGFLYPDVSRMKDLAAYY